MKKRAGNFVVSVRADAKHLGGTRVQYTCPEGHVWTEDLGRKSLPVSKRLTETGVAFLARYWGRRGQGVTIPCRKCTEAARQEQTTARS